MYYLSAYNFLKKKQDGRTYKCCIETLCVFKASLVVVSSQKKADD